MLSQKRTIEKRGLLILTQEEREALDLEIHIKILQQFPNGGSYNLRIYPPRSWFGWATFIYGTSVFSAVELQFWNQCIYKYSRVSEQAAGIEMLNLDTLLMAMQTLSIQITPPTGILSRIPPVPVVYPICPLSLINFELPEGIVLEVQTHILVLSADATIFVEERDNTSPPGDDTGGGDAPPTAPPKGAPPSTKREGDLLSGGEFEISPPYDGDDDNGRTYVPPISPPWLGDNGQEEGIFFDVRVEINNYASDGTFVLKSEVTNRLLGPIKGLGTYGNPSSGDSRYGVKHGNNQLRDFGPQSQFRLGTPVFLDSSYQELEIIEVTRAS